MDTDTQIVTGPAHWFDSARDIAGGAVAGRFARDPHNGKAPPVRTSALAAAMEAAREADARHAAIACAAKRAAEAMAGPCPTLLDGAYHEADAIAASLRRLAEKYKLYGRSRAAITLFDIAGLLETVAAEQVGT